MAVERMMLDSINMWVSLDWLLTAVLFMTTVILVKINMSMQKKKQILGDMPTYPGYLPLLGHAHLATRFTYKGFVDELIKTRKENKGTLHIFIGPKVCGYIANPSDIERVINRKDALHKGSLFGFFKSHSQGLLNHMPPRWNYIRKISTIPLAHKQMLDSFLVTFQEQSRTLLEILSPMEGSDYFDLSPYLSRCCQDITYGSLFGVRLDIQHNEKLSVQDSLAKVISLTLERMMKVWLYPSFIYFRTKRGRTMSKCIEHHRNIVNKIVSERKRLLQEANESLQVEGINKKMPKLLDAYIENGLPYEEIITEVMDFILVGFEAPAMTQGWVLLLLSMFPQHQDAVHRELDQVLGKEEDLTLELLQKCQYLDMVTRETLRLFGLPVLIRKLTEDVSIDHYTLPADAEMIVCMCLVHRDPRYYDHPNSFYPEHFLPEKVAARPKYAYIPFGGGPRKCPAYAYSITIVKFIVASLLRKYRFTTKLDFNNLPLDLMFMYKPTDGFLLKYERR